MSARAWENGSSGSAGFKGSRKSTPYAAQLAAANVARAVMDAGMREVDVFIKGPGPGRESALRREGTEKAATAASPLARR